MSRVVALLGCLLLPFTVGCLSTFRHTRTSKQEIKIEGLTGIDLKTFNGSVEVESHPFDTVDVDITFTAYGMSDEQAIANCESLDAVFTPNDEDMLVIESIKPAGISNASISYKLRVPEYYAMKIKTSNGAVGVSGLAAPVDVKTSNGRVELEDIASEAKAVTSNGRVKLVNIAGKLYVSTSNGSISYQGFLSPEEHIAKTSNGKISFDIPSEQRVLVKARTSNGSIRCEMPNQRIIDEGKRNLEAIVGMGDPAETMPTIDLKTSNGSIYVEPATIEEPEAIDIPTPPTPPEPPTTPEVNSNEGIAL